MPPERMKRVTKKNPCPICNKPDWCLAAEDGSAAICQRVSEGSVKRCGDAGWLHILKDRHERHKRHKVITRILNNFGKKGTDFGYLAKKCIQNLSNEKLCWLSKRLNVSNKSLTKLQLGWDGKAFTFPMSNAYGQIIGVRRRFPNGAKLSAKSSKAGLFIPNGLSSQGLLVICEGPTDCAAALDLGFDSIGRPNCNSCMNMTARFAVGRKVVIVGDSDEAGKSGAERLVNYLIPRCSKVRIIYPRDGIKDLRDWLEAGLTHNELQQIIEQTTPLKMELK